MKRRILCLMVSLLLVGVVNAQNLPAYVREHDNNMPVVAQVVLDETPVTSGWTLNAYVGDDLRGTAEIQPTLYNTYWIQVYYDTPAQGEDSPTVSFKITNGTEEYSSTTTLTAAPEGYGTPGTPQVLYFTKAVEQTVVLTSGTNWVSFNVEITLDALKEAIVEAIPDASIVIKSQGGSMTYNPLRDRWIGSIDWDLTSSFRIEVPAEGEFEVSLVGMRLNGVDAITIVPGENWIAFPFATSMTLSEAFYEFATNGDVVTNQQGSSTYNSVRQRWIGSVSNLESGRGYLYNSKATETKTFTFPQPSR